MKTYNMSIDKFIKYIQNKEIYIYGIGDFYKRLTQRSIYKDIHKNVAGYIDNGRKGGKINVLGGHYEVHGIELLKSIRKGIVLLCGTTYLAEMYEMLLSECLPDTIECFIMPLIWVVSDGKDDAMIMERLYADSIQEQKIEKKIHCCWFSGEKKPDKYQRCIDTWKQVCPDYEIIEWDADSYDCKKNIFVKQAFEKEKWAFLSDYARLDVVYNYGGIYLDMDVELIKDFSPLLQFDAFFNYGMRHVIELGSGFGGVKHNPFIGSLLKLYEGVEFLDEDGNPQIERFVQPGWINQSFVEKGFWMNGNMQMVEDMLLLPRRFYTPKDDFFLYNYLQCDQTRGIHHFNSEWRPQEYFDQRQKKVMWIADIENIL